MEYGKDIHTRKKMRQKVFFKTFGCRTNLFDTQVMIENLKDFEISSCEEKAQIIIINSCTVTNGADSAVRGYLTKMEKLGKKIYFTGCGVATKGSELLPRVQGIFAHDHKEKINSLLKQKEKFFLPTHDALHIDSTILSEFVGKSRAFIKIQEGCDFNCSYCIIPFSRGRARSVPEDLIFSQAQHLARNGIQEIVLTGTNMGSYGKDTQTSVAKLIKKISQIKGIKRIRIGSLEPSQITDEFLELLGEKFLEKHLHIALQHTHNKMLEIMNRQNRFESDLALFERIAEKGFALGSDYIIGHPGESEAIWQEAFENLKHFPLTHIHPFIYSPRNGTPSAEMKNQTRGNIAKERLHALNELITENNFRFRQQHANIPLEVLIESTQGETILGLDQFFNKLRIHTSETSLTWITIPSYQIHKNGNTASI